MKSSHADAMTDDTNVPSAQSHSAPGASHYPPPKPLPIVTVHVKPVMLPFTRRARQAGHPLGSAAQRVRSALPVSSVVAALVVIIVAVSFAIASGPLWRMSRSA
jgi:hypothetical protein